MTVPEIYAAELEVFGAEPGNATDVAKARCVTDINAAIQLVAAAGPDFYGREPVQVSMQTGVQKYALPKTTQTVLEPVYLTADDTLLRKLTTRAQLAQYRQLFQGGLGAGGPANGKPVAYHIESLRDTDGTSGAADSVKLVLHLLPPPTSAYHGQIVMVEVISDALAITEADLTNDAKKVPMPHGYAESILLPIVRWNATTSFLFTQRELLDRYKEDYAQAIALLNREPSGTSSNIQAPTSNQEQPQGERRAA